MRTAIGLSERTEPASIERRFVPMADGRVRWCELAFLLPTQRKPYDQRAGALSSSSQKSRIATGRTRTQKPACAYVQVGSYIANVCGRSRSRAYGRDASEPEALIYEPQPSGNLRLVGNFIVFGADVGERAPTANRPRRRSVLQAPSRLPPDQHWLSCRTKARACRS
jgi:hypothetical protein